MHHSVSAKTAAGVVAFDPDGGIVSLVASLLAETCKVFVFVNAVISKDILQELENFGPRCSIIRAQHNFGIAEALNQIMLNAILIGCERTILFDQDSRPDAGAIAQLESLMDRLIAADVRPAVVGPAVVAPQGMERAFKSPRYFRVNSAMSLSGVVQVRYVITSGSLIHSATFLRVGKFRSDFFIDAVDTEWCFRASSLGYSCWYAPGVRMQHEIGTGVVSSKWLGLSFPQQSRMRMTAYFRNQSACLRLPHIPPGWKARIALHMMRLAIGLTFDSRFGFGFLPTLLKAVSKGLMGELGPPEGAVGAVVMRVSPD